jgi:hypothetical protein
MDFCGQADEKTRKSISEQLKSLEGDDTRVKSGGSMKGQCPGIRHFLCQAVVNDLDYLIEHGIFASDVQAIQSAITQITTEERTKELRKLRSLSKWREENA